MVIVHGKSELNICKAVRSNLKIKQEIVSEKNGSHSIQVTSILKKLEERNFKNFSSFIREYPDIEHKKKELINFKIFIIMDLDDCNDIDKKNFKNKQMFKNHWLYDYIIPIYNEPNLEATMNFIGINVEKKADYIKIFPTNHGDLDVNMVEQLSKKIKKTNKSNLSAYFEYCLSIEKENSINFD